MKPKSIEDAIRVAGGSDSVPQAAEALAQMSLRTEFPVSVEAVLKWRYRGVPERHWPLFKKVCDFEDLHKLNRLID